MLRYSSVPHTRRDRVPQHPSTAKVGSLPEDDLHKGFPLMLGPSGHLVHPLRLLSLNSPVFVLNPRHSPSSIDLGIVLRLGRLSYPPENLP